MLIQIFDNQPYEIPEDTRKIVIHKDKTEREVSDTLEDGTEIVFCGEDKNGEYIGWTPRDRAEANGYDIHKTDIETIVVDFVIDSVVKAS